MNTNTATLKTDVTIQKGLVALNALVFLVSIVNPHFLVIILPLQFFGGIYQLVSSGIHLRLAHKSLGYRQYRLLHFWGCLAYLCAIILWSPHLGQIVPTIFVVIIPQVIFYCYFALCYFELKQLQHREFHILR
jgi:hypothetical protein